MTRKAQFESLYEFIFILDFQCVSSFRIGRSILTAHGIKKESLTDLKKAIQSKVTDKSFDIGLLHDESLSAIFKTKKYNAFS